MNIVRTDTLFGSKKNIVGSTSSDLVLETLGKVYIKTGKSTKTLTEILSLYSKEGKSETSEVTTEQIQNLLSEEYITLLVNSILLKNKKFGDFVSIDDLKNVGNENLPVYFDSKSLPKTITGLDVTNNIHTEAEVIGETGVSTKGISDISMYGGYDVTPRVLEILSNYTFTNSSYLNEELLMTYLIGYKEIQQPIEITSNFVTSTNNIPRIIGISQDLQGIISIVTDSFPIATASQIGLLSYEQQTIAGEKTFTSVTNFNSAIHAATSIDFTSGSYNEPLVLTSNKFTIGSNTSGALNQKIPIDVKSSLSHFFGDIHADGDVYAEGGMSAKGLTDLAISGSYQNSTGFSGLLYFVGDVRGQGNTEANITITIEDEAVTNNKIKYPFIQLAGQSISLGTNISQSDLQDLLGVRSLITSAMKIEGTTTTDIITDNTISTVVISGENKTAYNGMVIFYQNKEFVWVDNAWKELGDESSFMLKGSGVTDIRVSGDYVTYSKDGGNTFEQITVPYATKSSQDANGLSIDGNYLKLSGGTLCASNSPTPLIIKGGESSNAGIIFQNNLEVFMGQLGVKTISNVNTPYFYDNTDFRTIWHSNNSNKSDVNWKCNTFHAYGIIYAHSDILPNDHNSGNVGLYNKTFNCVYAHHIFSPSGSGLRFGCTNGDIRFSWHNAMSNLGSSTQLMSLSSNGDLAIKRQLTVNGGITRIGASGQCDLYLKRNTISGGGTPTNYIHIPSNARLQFDLHDEDSSSTVQALVINSNANIGIGVSNPLVKLDVDGDIYATGGIAAGGILDLTIFYPYS